MKRLLTLAVSLQLLAFSFLAAPVNAQGEYELLQAGKTIESDYIRAANQVQIDGDVKGDAFFAGGIVTVNGKVDGDLFVAGGKVNVNGEVGNSVRVVGGDVTINGPVGRNVSIVCGNCTVTRQATISGSLLAAGGNLELSAEKIGKGFRFFGGRLYLNSTISNEAFIVADREFLLGPQASISGDLKYTGNTQVVVQPGATVAGHIAYENINKDENFPRFFGARPIFNLFEKFKPVLDLFGFVVSAIVGFVLLGLFPKFFEKVSRAMEVQPFASLGWGVIVLLIVPLVAILFAITLVGIPLSLLILGLGYVVLLVAKYLMAFFLGRRILLSRFRERRGWALLAGLFIFYLLGLIPIAGNLAKLIFYLFALGGMVLSHRHPEIWKKVGAEVNLSKQKISGKRQ